MEVESDMMNIHPEAFERLKRYTAQEGRYLNEQLGYGYDGIVYSTNQKTAIKAFKYEQQYSQERDVYRRLTDNEIQNIAGFNVPQLELYDDELWCVEMQIVTPPYVLDFAGAYLDKPPPFSDEEMAEWHSDKKELFEERWPTVKIILSKFRRFGIYLNDVKPGNIVFE